MKPANVWTRAIAGTSMRHDGSGGGLREKTVTRTVHETIARRSRANRPRARAMRTGGRTAMRSARVSRLEDAASLNEKRGPSHARGFEADVSVEPPAGRISRRPRAILAPGALSSPSTYTQCGAPLDVATPSLCAPRGRRTATANISRISNSPNEGRPPSVNRGEKHTIDVWIRRRRRRARGGASRTPLDDVDDAVRRLRQRCLGQSVARFRQK